MNPYLFVIGCPRSGTTLLRRMLDAHPMLAMTPETHWVPRLFERGDGLTPAGDVTPEFISDLVESEDFKKLKISRDEVLKLAKAQEPITYARLVTGIYDLFGTRRGKPLVGDKTPGYTRAVETLHKLFPRARFVHLIRDGRDVCLSATTWSRVGSLEERFPSWRAHPVGTAALWWEWHVRLARAAARRLIEGQYYEMHYEALVADPEAECRKLCGFLGLVFDARMLGFHEGRTITRPGLSAKKSWQPVTPGLRRWREQMAPDDVRRFEAAAGSLLEELGYERAIKSPTNAELGRAARLREAFVADLRSRGRSVPAAWSQPA